MLSSNFVELAALLANFGSFPRRRGGALVRHRLCGCLQGLCGTLARWRLSRATWATCWPTFFKIARVKWCYVVCPKRYFSEKLFGQAERLSFLNHIVTWFLNDGIQFHWVSPGQMMYTVGHLRLSNLSLPVCILSGECTRKRGKTYTVGRIKWPYVACRTANAYASTMLDRFYAYGRLHPRAPSGWTLYQTDRLGFWLASKKFCHVLSHLANSLPTACQHHSPQP